MGRDGNHRLVDGVAQKSFSILLYLLKDECGNLLGRIFLPLYGYLVVGTHFSFYLSYGPLRIGNSLSHSGVAYEKLPIFGESYDRRKHLTR